MSKTDSLHYQLCIEGAKWLHKKKKSQDGAGALMNGCLWAFKYVAVEINTAAAENPDVWGFDGNYSAIIEVKTSHSDFLSDRKKWCRSKEAEEVGLQAGTFRWYLCPEGVIKPEEVPDGWGLLYWNGSKIEHIKGAPKHENTSRSDLLILSSILRREGFPTKIYNYRHQNTTINHKKCMRTTKVITPYFEDGEFAGVRVTLGDEDFVIAPKDYRESDAMTWPEAMDALKEDGLSTFNYRQICFTMAYRKEVDKVLKDNGGDGLDNRYWTCAECMVYNSFIYNGGNSCLYIYSKNCTCSVRPIKNLKEE